MVFSVLLLIADDALLHPVQYCPSSITRERLVTCIQNKPQPTSHVTTEPSISLPDFQPVPSLKPSPFCEARQQCKLSSFLTDPCEDDWRNNVRKSLCKCADNIRSEFFGDQFVQQYETCARGAVGDVTFTSGLRDDIIFDWLDDYLKTSCSSSPALIPSISWNRPVSGCEFERTTGGLVVETTTSPIAASSTVPPDLNTTIPPLFPPETTTSTSPTAPTVPTLFPPETTSPTVPPPEGQQSSTESGAETTRTWFFEKFTDPSQPAESESESTTTTTTTTEATTTAGNILGINNILGIKVGPDGLLGNFLNFSQVSNGLQGIFHG